MMTPMELREFLTTARAIHVPETKIFEILRSHGIGPDHLRLLMLMDRLGIDMVADIPQPPDAVLVIVSMPLLPNPKRGTTH